MRAQVRGWIEALSQRPTQAAVRRTRQAGASGDARRAGRQRSTSARSRNARTTRYGLVVQRADLRTFPTALRVFTRAGDTDIDRFQESALFPGTPVVIAHESRDGEWWFVVSTALCGVDREAACRRRAAAAGVRLRAARRPISSSPAPPRAPCSRRSSRQVSELQLDMGVRVPVLADWPADKPVNGQHPYTAHVIELPVRDDDGSLRFAPALLPRTRTSPTDYLPLSRANLLRQGFKFLGERYGWGHSYNARDCSGFVSEVYRSFGVQLPRNTATRRVSPAFEPHRLRATDDSHEQRLAVAARTAGRRPGLHPRPRDDGDRPATTAMPYVIHDTTGISYRGDDGKLARVHAQRRVGDAADCRCCSTTRRPTSIASPASSASVPDAATTASIPNPAA